ncbi:hypothetical protein ACIP93_30780 [Streptomyces sp. NPDC088745]|uniref:hypothetical protein n=1 Tax=Streptomyces sp. NPDC088745 TaxID=3365884 RepID=UPI00381F6D1C
MVHIAPLSATVTVALCGVLTLAPAAVASPEARTAPAAASTGSAPVVPPDEKLASTFQTVGKFGDATQETSELAGMVVKGEKDKQKLDKAHKESDESLDNLLAIIPGGSPANFAGRAATPQERAAAAAASREAMRAAVELIKADTKALVEAALKGDAAGYTKVGGTLVVHLGQLATAVFLEVGVGAVKDVVPPTPVLGPAPLPKAPALPGAEAAGGAQSLPGSGAQAGLPGASAQAGHLVAGTADRH